MDKELHDLLELVNTVAPQHSDAKSELITLLVVWNSQLNLLHEFLEHAPAAALQLAVDVHDTLEAIDRIKQGTRWGG